MDAPTFISPENDISKYVSDFVSMVTVIKYTLVGEIAIKNMLERGRKTLISMIKKISNCVQGHYAPI